MRLSEREETNRIPGTAQTSTKRIVEWVCPYCDYFEEAEAGDRDG
jgi:hypothetical protein